MTDFHNQMLDRHEASQDKEQLVTQSFQTFTITTDHWEETLFSVEELHKEIAVAVEMGLQFKVETCPF